MDIDDTIAPKSNQMNADDLVSGPRTLTITEVRVLDSVDQPVHIFFDEFPSGRPWKPSLGMRRVLINVWGKRSAEYVGKRITLYRDDSVTWAGEAIGGIRIGAMSGLAEPRKLPLTVSQKQRRLITIEPLPDTAPPPSSPPSLEDRIAGMVAAYAKGGITHAMLEAREGRAMSEWDEGNVANLSALFEALKSGEKSKADEFPELGDES